MYQFYSYETVYAFGWAVLVEQQHLPPSSLIYFRGEECEVDCILENGLICINWANIFYCLHQNQLRKTSKNKKVKSHFLINPTISEIRNEF